ncbi:conserved hypothetical protein [Paecilomyces variotii No. 5]|uniref:Uncharacterized protein n=1 Tax=Byssochlamys spectabilis (strain No. 5 / NBRC 109023) TaxID=1356009 RepID=V5FJG7_BYSSN|nr:conserved hypothetical protein [Paecilomyces variotii No. 5]
MPTVGQFAVYAISLALNAADVQALPFSTSNPHAELEDTNQITFDPLAVAAVLHNPRADLSAAKLYTQYDRDSFTWPHTMMMGGTLTPVKMLVEHLTATYASVHPALSLCTRNIQKLEIKSNIIFRELPLSFCNIWLNDALSFRSSDRPGNDFMIVYIDDILARRKPPTSDIWARRLVLQLISLLTGFILVVGVVFGVLTADIWAVTLFFLYTMHWLASALISRTSLVKVHMDTIKPDPTPTYAIYERPSGGNIVFKGRYDALERWGRMTWEYRTSPINDLMHWFWVISGTLAAISSVACMVNMRGYMQLAFLGVLAYASLAEILATRLAGSLQYLVQGSGKTCEVKNNNTRTQGIIRATVEVDPEFRLTGLDWVKLAGLPNLKIFREMIVLLGRINDVQSRSTSELDHKFLEDIEKEFSIFYQSLEHPDHPLANRIVSEVRDALTRRRRPSGNGIGEAKGPDVLYPAAV